MSKTPNYDAKVKALLDATMPGERVCALTGEKWEMTEEEIGWYKKFNVPPAKLSPLTRMRLLTCHWPAGQWWYHKHAETGKPLITGIHPASGMKILPDKEWFAKDFCSTSADCEVGAPFFDQLLVLRRAVPFSASQNYEEAANSICFNSWGDQNSYFVTGSKTKNAFFCGGSFDVESSAEVCLSQSVTSSYHVVHSERIHKSRYVFESRDCLHSAFVFDCRNCESCFGATNKRNRKFLFFNEQLTETAWKEKMAGINFGNKTEIAEYRRRFEQLMAQAVWPENFNEKTERSVGEYLTDCLDCRFVYYGSKGAQRNYWSLFAIGRSEENAFAADVVNASNNYCSTASTCRGCLFSIAVSRCQSCEFCLECYDCENCFGCVGLRHKKFCILNQQYKEEEYWVKVDEVKCTMLERGEYGQSIPAKFAPAYLPESAASKIYLADDEFGHKVGGQMFDPLAMDAIGEELALAKEVVDVSSLPENIGDLEGWAGKALYDPVFKRRFALLAPEIALYKELHIAPPTEHFIVRIREMFDTSNSAVFIPSECTVCKKQIVVGKNVKYPHRKIVCREHYLEHLEKNG